VTRDISTPAPGPNRPSEKVRIGFIALTDCAPLLVADGLGYFEKQGIQVELHREAGWASIREKILYGQLDATHAVVGLGLSLRLGLQGLTCPAIVPFVFNLHGNAITLSTDLWRRGVRDAATLGKLVRSAPERMLTLGIVARTSSHNFMMRRWLQSGGIDPDRDVRLVVLPPTQMTGTLSAGLIDGYCVGDPWNSQAVVQGIGWCPAISQDVMPRHPEKVLVTTEDFAARKPDTLSAVVRALHEACAFCDVPKNREQVVEIIHSSGQLRTEREVLRMSLVGPFDDGTKQRKDAESFYIFNRFGANEPTPAKATWLAEAFLKHGLVTPADTERVHAESQACYRRDLYELALGSPASSTPKPSSKTTPKPKSKRASHSATS